MRNGLAAGPLPAGLVFATEIEAACSRQPTFSPLVAYAIKYNETGDSANPAEMQEGTWPGSDYLTLPDGSGPDPKNPAGHGIFQLTSAWPWNWADPFGNAVYALTNFLIPAETHWEAIAQGDDLVRCIAAEFNAGPGNAMRGHNEGDVDKYTTNHYADRALQHYQALKAGNHP